MFPHRKWFCSICFINTSHFSFIFWYDFRQSFHYLCVWININVQLFSSLSNIMWRNVNSSIKSVNDAELYRVIGGNGVNSNKGNQYFFPGICMSVRSECQYSHQTMTKSCIVLQSIFSPFLIFFLFCSANFTKTLSLLVSHDHDWLMEKEWLHTARNVSNFIRYFNDHAHKPQPIFTSDSPMILRLRLPWLHNEVFSRTSSNFVLNSLWFTQFTMHISVESRSNVILNRLEWRCSNLCQFVAVSDWTWLEMCMHYQADLPEWIKCCG